MIVTLGDLVCYSEQAMVETYQPTVKFKLTDLENWYSSPPVKVDIVDVPYGDNAFPPIRSYRGAKLLQLDGVCYSANVALAISEAYEAIAALFSDGNSLTLQVEDELGTRTQTVWLNGQPQVAPFGPGKAKFQVPLVAPDGRKYAPQLSQIAQPGGAQDGLIWPLFDDGTLSFGTFAPSGLFQFTNNGKADSWPLFQVTGLVDSEGFTIDSDEYGLTFASDVPSGQILTLSPYTGGRAVLNGVDVTGGNLTRSNWPVIKPGETRSFSFSLIGAGDVNTQLEAFFSDAWW